jgi:uncharacterized membrane protein YgaE (UPF0421/DUF939 family)
MTIKKHKTMSPEMLYGTVLGLVFGAVFKQIIFGMIIGGGIGSTFHYMKDSSK